MKKGAATSHLKKPLKSGGCVICANVTNPDLGLEVCHCGCFGSKHTAEHPHRCECGCGNFRMTIVDATISYHCIQHVTGKATDPQPHTWDLFHDSEIFSCVCPGYELKPGAVDAAIEQLASMR